MAHFVRHDALQGARSQQTSQVTRIKTDIGHPGHPGRVQDAPGGGSQHSAGSVDSGEVDVDEDVLHQTTGSREGESTALFGLKTVQQDLSGEAAVDDALPAVGRAVNRGEIDGRDGGSE